MSRTDHHRYSTPDPWRTNTQRPERQARPAGRLKKVVEDEMAAEGDLTLGSTGCTLMDMSPTTIQIEEAYGIRYRRLTSGRVALLGERNVAVEVLSEAAFCDLLNDAEADYGSWFGYEA